MKIRTFSEREIERLAAEFPTAAPFPHMVIVKVASNRQIRKIDFVRSEYFARAANGVVLGMIEIVVIGDIRPNLWSEEL